MNWRFGGSRCKLLYLGLIDTEVLLYSTWNYIQSPEINHKMERNTHTHIYLSHFAVQQKLAHYNSTVL